MKNKLLYIPLFLLCSTCTAGDLPIVGLVEMLPVTKDGIHVSARPIYILTDQKLTGPTVFSGLKGVGSSYEVACCYEVKDTTPTTLKAELSKYGKDPEFSSHMRGLKGYRYIYSAEIGNNKHGRTYLMRTLVKNASNPDDASPFSAAAVAAQFTKDNVPATFDVGGISTTLKTRLNSENDRIIYTFLRNGRVIELSEDNFPD